VGGECSFWLYFIVLGFPLLSMPARCNGRKHGEGMTAHALRRTLRRN
jgi:hypothetical protein